MDDSSNSSVISIDATPFVYASMETVGDVIARFVASGSSPTCLNQVLAIVIAELEGQAFLARLTNRTHIFEGKLTTADALQRSCELRQLTFS